MPKVKDKGGRNVAKGVVASTKGKPYPKAGGKTRSKVEVHKDAVLKESNQVFDVPPRFRGANWTRPEIVNLFIAANARRVYLKGQYEYHSGGNDSRARAWTEVAEYVNQVSVQTRSLQQCKNKITDFVSDAKDKLRELKKAMAKSGSPAIPDHLHLLPEDNMALDYAGDEAVTGIPGTHPSTLFRKRAKRVVPVPWSSYRKEKINYYNAFKATKENE